jgi:hypothetical protein
MGFEHLFDVTLRVWRPSKALGPQRNEIVTYAQVGTDSLVPNAVVNRPSARLGDPGPGLTPVGERRLYMTVTANIQARDVVQFVSGPDAGYRGEVDDAPTRPRNNHTEIVTKVWRGKLPGDA